MKRIILLLLLFFFVSSAFNVSSANETALTSYDVTYKVSENGLTNVAFKVGLTNTTSDYYTSSYSLELGFNDIKNVKASDADGIISPIVSKSENGEKIKLNFNSRVVGMGKTLNFNFSFDTPEIAQNQGKIWEINIPGLPGGDKYKDFNVHVLVPKSFGNASYVKPERDLSDLNFTKEELGESGISIAFGEFQNYIFDLTYHIKNPNLFPIKTEIALPPETNYQRIILEDIAPKPLNVVRDKDGNWLAEYFLMPGAKNEIKVTGKSQLSLTPRKENAVDADLKEYLKEKKYWKFSNSKIKEISKNLKTPKEIYDYTVKTLKYDFSRVLLNKPRVGSEGVLSYPESAVCMEFTDLFIALARSAGIPAREVDGFAYTQNSKQRPVSLVKDILHAWPEYYDYQKRIWVMVDPTWGNTTGGVDYFDTLDFDHFAFVIRGQDSTYPIPAGGYKLEEDENKKDVNISFTSIYEEMNPTIEAVISLPDKAFSFLPVGGNIILKNNGYVLFPSQTLEIKSDLLKPAEENIIVKDIPPFGYVKIPVSFERTPLFTRRKAVIEFKIKNRAFYQTIDISPFYFWKLIKFGK